MLSLLPIGYFLVASASAGYLFLIEPPGDYSEPPGKNPSISTASPGGSVRKKGEKSYEKGGKSTGLGMI